MKDDALLIDVHSLNKHFGDKHVVKDLSMEVRRGEIFGFLGPNGSGKTTSLRMMCGLLTPDSGYGTCLGFDILKQSREIKRRVGYMTQRFTYWEDLTVRENLDFVARLYQIPQRKVRVDRIVDELRLGSRVDQLAGSLSGGWKQRLALAAALLQEPELLLLDEPTAGVDPSARREFWEELHRLAAQGISVLVSTHYMDEAERCHKLAYISYGVMLAQGEAHELVRRQALHTWVVTGRDLVRLNERLQNTPGIDQVVAFGKALHVSGVNAELLERSLSGICNEGVAIQKIDTSLEHVFLHLMKDVQSEFC
ncbi:multidrug ABC transporter ATP-binding protein [Burkholderia ubonensis]|uniref:Multidrug ABC transporter ATP-binding protein n=1 Tax=Burkholderia ubonensis TaxID=101571 RepID=A0ABD4EAQ1_9BURK|nr:ABC transporter ATP-binding protein [Burkholderia ubonensis]KVN92610.1 multidrug ABC transporter ATP-binding protein [Burkholderia ubonensis]KVN94468.1 multidrug ABC transporter ATP-binding protein [Burkholderia ubonensis]KVO15946.1 multidrug ABC transporter ATP-binding protein [Burkholderia ubonensis]KVO74356.1 multidrug ABC transporter ATP-binding protein [Burkholderia ubonensis]KVR15256.1 multidrug ABC transporter ATP-binding protein [Burkholderia ubonensis]